MCKFCETGLSLIGEWSGAEKGTRFAKYLWVESSKIGLEVHHETGNSFLDYIEINYCPNCGKKLIKGECE